MTRWHIFRTGAGWRIGLALASSAMLFAACSGDDDDGGDGDGAGNGGGNGDGSSFEVGTDEEYVDALCTSFVTFTEDFFSAAIDLGSDPTDEEAIEVLTGPFEGFRDGVADAPVPEDLQDYHSQIVSTLNDVVDALNDGDVSALEDDSAFEFPDLPADAQERLQAVAADNPDCANVGIFDEEA